MLVAAAQDLVRPELAEPGMTPAGEFRVSHLFRAEAERGPQAYVVESYSLHAEVPIHFHVVDQFQVFLAGEGTFQRHGIRQHTVHYTDRYSTYGPIVAGDAGLTFAVLRQEYDPGGNYMPGSREKLLGRPGRNLEIDTEKIGRGSEGLLVCDPDGLLVEILSVEAGTTREALAARPGAGRYCMVLEGEVAVGSGDSRREDLAPWSCVFVGPSDEALTVEGVAEQSRLLVLGFPGPPEG